MEGWKSRRIENILISLLFVGWEWKSGSMEKVSLYKFTHIPLTKNDAQKVTRKKKKKKENKAPCHSPENQKKKKRKK